MTTHEVRILRDLDRWFDESDGGNKVVSLGWSRYDAVAADKLVESGHLARVNPPGRRNGFYVLTPLGEDVIR